jgi:hypothetical protein
MTLLLTIGLGTTLGIDPSGDRGSDPTEAQRAREGTFGAAGLEASQSIYGRILDDVANR